MLSEGRGFGSHSSRFCLFSYSFVLVETYLWIVAFVSIPWLKYEDAMCLFQNNYKEIFNTLHTLKIQDELFLMVLQYTLFSYISFRSMSPLLLPFVTEQKVFFVDRLTSDFSIERAPNTIDVLLLNNMLLVFHIDARELKDW